jgi:hypothetical protein
VWCWRRLGGWRLRRRRGLPVHIRHLWRPLFISAFVARAQIWPGYYWLMGALVTWGRRAASVMAAAAIHRPWAATSALMAAPVGPLLLAVTVNSPARPRASDLQVLVHDAVLACLDRRDDSAAGGFFQGSPACLHPGLLQLGRSNRGGRWRGDLRPYQPDARAGYTSAKARVGCGDRPGGDHPGTALLTGIGSSTTAMAVAQVAVTAARESGAGVAPGRGGCARHSAQAVAPGDRPGTGAVASLVARQASRRT